MPTPKDDQTEYVVVVVRAIRARSPQEAAQLALDGSGGHVDVYREIGGQEVGVLSVALADGQNHRERKRK